ncbi:hypothetical protein H5410_043420 [Solanum commersonii]|uniref:Uncharacterized protein n=1 Tax=Solanum commersonii TaxID=4109 RepID=A0A9J5XYT6_SOLCO|nr:hypothetical protein H5410_043420 [Solanum commersonii]
MLIIAWRTVHGMENLFDSPYFKLRSKRRIAFMAAMKGYKMVLKMPLYTSMERRGKMRAFRADLILIDPT